MGSVRQQCWLEGMPFGREAERQSREWITGAVLEVPHGPDIEHTEWAVGRVVGVSAPVTELLSPVPSSQSESEKVFPRRA